MPVESWMTPEDTAAHAAQAASLIDATLSRLTEEERVAFWSSVLKCYNTPYNDPKPRALPRRPAAAEPATPRLVEIADIAEIAMPMAAIPATAAFAENRAS